MAAIVTKPFTFYVVGVGGTGSLFARDLPQLLIGTKHSMVLIDGDVVEEKNIRRQSYQLQDVGMNKAIALARKLNSFYSINCAAIDKYVTDKELIAEIKRRDTVPVIVGCVDNDNTRKLLEKTFKTLDSAVYIDSANSEYSGNVYTCARIACRQIGKRRSEVYKLADDKNPTEKSCQEQAAAGNVQYFITNDRMAMCVLEHCFNLINGEPWLMGVTNIDRFTEVHY